MLKKSAETMGEEPQERLLPSIEIRESQQDTLLKLINLGTSLLGEKTLETRDTVSDETFYELNGKISPTPTGFALIGFL